MQVVQLLERRKSKLELTALPFPFSSQHFSSRCGVQGRQRILQKRLMHVCLPYVLCFNIRPRSRQRRSFPTPLITLLWIPPTHLPTYLPIYLPTYLPTYLLTYQPLTNLPTHLPTYLPTYQHTFLPTYLPTYPTYLPTYQPTTYQPSYLHTHLPTSFRETTRSYFQLATRTTQSFLALIIKHWKQKTYRWPSRWWSRRHWRRRNSRPCHRRPWHGAWKYSLGARLSERRLTRGIRLLSESTAKIFSKLKTKGQSENR